MFLGNYPWKLLAKRKRQASVRDCTKSARQRFRTQDVCYLEHHLTTRPHETLLWAFIRCLLCGLRLWFLCPNTPIHKYTKDGFSSVWRFFSFATVFYVFVLPKKWFVWTDTRIRIQNDHFLFVYSFFLFVARIEGQIFVYFWGTNKYTDAKKDAK